MTTNAVSFSDAMTQINQIVEDIEQKNVSLDDLGGKVKVAAGLIKDCRARLKSTETEVNEALKDLDGEPEVKVLAVVAESVPVTARPVVAAVDESDPFADR